MDLPKYERLNEESSSLLPSDIDDLPDAESSSAPTYPPGTSTSAARGRMNYIFNPAFPVPGQSQRAVGKMGADRAETLNIARRAFPTLEDYPASRITFSIPITNSANQGYQWSRLLDEAWEFLKEDGVEEILVEVLDGPGDQALREKKALMENLSCFGTFLLICFLILAVIGTAAYFGSSSSKKTHTATAAASVLGEGVGKLMKNGTRRVGWGRMD